VYNLLSNTLNSEDRWKVFFLVLLLFDLF